jgi:O-antigen/teichoic acid export membrane protein
MTSLPPKATDRHQALRSLGRRFGWGVADQALSSLTNFTLGLVAARTLSSTEFGAFALMFSGYLICLGAARAMASEPLTIRFAAVSKQEWRRGTSGATGAALILGVFAGLVCVAIGTVVGESRGSGLLALGATLPGLLLQDTWRFAFFARRRGSSAFANDLVWAFALFGGMAVLLTTRAVSVGSLVAVWGVSGAIAGIFGMLQSSVMPSPPRIGGWFRNHKDLIPRYLGEFAVSTVAGQISAFGLGALGGLAQVGALRAGQLLLGPLNVLFLGVGVAAVPEGVRALQVSSSRLLRSCRRLAMTLALCALTLGVAVWAIPDSAGTALLRKNWTGGHALVIPLALGMAGFGTLLGAGVGLRALAAARMSFRARLLTAPLSLLGGLGGAAVNGAAGAAWGLAAAFMAGAVIWWLYFLKGLIQYDGAKEASDVRPDGRVEVESMAEGAPYA